MVRRFVRCALLSALVALLLPLSPLGAQIEDFDAYSARSELAGDHADVFRLYWAFFDREPDVGGAQYWVAQYDQCASLLDITWSFGNSSEFRGRYGSLTNSQFVELVYSNVLGRVPDDEGRRYWVGLLDSGELIQAEVMLYFSLGQEFRNRRPLPSDGRSYDGCTDPSSVYYANCDAVRAAGAAPLRRGEPGYRSGLDRDDDGIACET